MFFSFQRVNTQSLSIIWDDAVDTYSNYKLIEMFCLIRRLSTQLFSIKIFSFFLINKQTIWPRPLSTQPSSLIDKFLNDNLQWGRWCRERTGCVAVQPRPLSEAGRWTENNKIITPFKKPFYFCPSLFLWLWFDGTLMNY